jgi:HK97 family phage portal protein
MGLLARLISGTLRADALPGPADDYWYQPRGVMTPAGVRMDAEAAKKISAWYRGRDILATVLAMLPLQVLERLPKDGGAQPARGNPLYDILHDKPNASQDSFQWRRQAMYHLIDHGNAYDEIIPGPRGFVDALRPIDPTLVTPELLVSGRKLFHVRDAVTNATRVLTQDEIFHLCGASDDGVVGKGILEYARTSLGTASATESYAANIFSRGTLHGGVIENPGVLDPEASKRMALSFITAAGNWHLPKILEQGSVFKPNLMTPENAQMLLSRRYTVDDIARWLGVPRQMLENSDPSYGNAEQFNQAFIDYTMGPWLALFEFAIADQLIIAPQKYYAQFTREALVRGNLGVRWAAHVAAVNAGIKSVDEVRAVENLNKRGGPADELREPQNITGKPAALDEGNAPPVPPPGSAPPPEDGSRALAEAIVTESAARVLRKEVVAVQKLAVRHAGDEEAFAEAVTEFYSKHVTLVSQTLQMSEAEASAYCAGQARQIVAGPWVDAIARWQDPFYAAGVAAIALEGI